MQLFQSVTLKLTLWYLTILMTISIVFSVVIYQLNFNEISSRLSNLQHSLYEITPGIAGFSIQQQTVLDGPGSPVRVQSEQAARQMALSLVYINLIVLGLGGLGSYFLARRTLRPIEKAHEAQSRFTSDASHELRTPLAAMKTELELTLRSKDISLDDAKEQLESNLEEVDKLINLSEMLLKLSRLDHDSLDKERLDFVSIFEEKMKLYKKDAKRFTITTRKTAFVHANNAAMYEVIGILVDNALKYSPPKTPIAVRIFERRGFVGFEIKNEGPSIPADKLPRIFDRFYRADASRTASGTNGYGLGLSIAKKIADVHHGDIHVVSKNDTTCFTLLLLVSRKVTS